MFNKIILGFVASLFLVACGEQSETQASQPAAEVIKVENAYIRAMPPGQKVTAMFLGLNNTSATPHKLIRAESNISESVELHEHKHDNGMMKMRQVENVAIPAEGTTTLQPGGYHIMMINLKQNLQLGQKVPVTLVFEDESSLPLQVEIKAITPTE